MSTTKHDDDARISALFARIDLQVSTNKALAKDLERMRAETALKFGVPTKQPPSQPAASWDGEEILKEGEDAASKDPAPTSQPATKDDTGKEEDVESPASKEADIDSDKGESKVWKEKKTHSPITAPDTLVRVSKDGLPRVAMRAGKGLRDEILVHITS